MKLRGKALFWSACALATMTVPAQADVQSGFQAWERGEYAAAVAEWRIAALKGDAVAQFNLGQAYKLGRGVEMDHEQALGWFKRAADQGHVEAFDNYGLLLFNMNRRGEAMPYIETSAARGESRAQYVLGTAHFNGDLATKDWPRAYALMSRASAKGLAQASARLAELDKLVPAQDRQHGMQLAAELEANEGRSQLASLPAVGSSKPTRALPPPPSGASAGAAKSAPIKVATAKPIKSSQQSPGQKPVPTAGSVSKPKAPAPKAVTVSNTGPWTVQIGAYSSQSNASAMWSRIAKRAPFSGYSPRYVKAGTVTRVQVGGFASRTGAEQFCRRAGALVADCFPVSR